MKRILSFEMTSEGSKGRSKEKIWSKLAMKLKPQFEHTLDGRTPLLLLVRCKTTPFVKLPGVRQRVSLQIDQTKWAYPRCYSFYSSDAEEKQLELFPQDRQDNWDGRHKSLLLLTVPNHAKRHHIIPKRCITYRSGNYRPSKALS